MLRFVAAVAVAAALAVSAAPAIAHQGDPSFSSVLRSVEPREPGLEVRVLNYDDSLELVNRTGRDVVVTGYDGEPYARLLADGRVEVNRSSPAAYLNDERLGRVPVPAGAHAGAEPRWERVEGDGRFAWHDHRIHWMGSGRPPSVRDPSARTKVFDYAVPLLVGDRPVKIHGTLYWVGEPGGGMPPVAIGALAALAAAALAGALVVRRRRARSSVPGR
ncbi:MAG: hypothetical protein LT070_00115 [Solirubrobacteraceae bacterium]|nr:hypothetical protein [Solirubrobacteraceae bacterium]